MKKISLASLNVFFENIARTHRLYLPVEKACEVNFGEWSPYEKVRLDAPKTVKSAKDVFFPQTEELMKFRLEGKSLEIEEHAKNDKDIVVFGIRGCDAQSFKILDRVFLVEPRDEYYAARRARATVVTLACGMPDTNCFCTNFGIDPAAPGGDATAWLIGDELYIKAGSEKGLALIEELEDADDAPVRSEQASIRAVTAKLPFAGLDLSVIGGMSMSELFDHPAWTSLSKGCLGCGACTFVCPTCQCYDIRDFDNGRDITRSRCWDSCMYSDFTLMAADNPRRTQMQRFRQRFMHKLVYFPQNNDGVFGCVGCGRCVAKCPQHINILSVIKALGGKKDA